MVAIKYLRRDLLADERFAEMFRGEAAVLASLDDPHVVRLYEYIESPSGAAIVMELVDGVSLRQILARQGATTPEAALVVLRGSLLGLAAAHERGVVHRDYKPDNVLVDAGGASKLTDFGIAARAGDRSARGGTLAYAPPEQFAGGWASPAGDVYAATATFFECLTGQPPFRGDTAAALMYQHMSEPVPVDAVPGPVRPLVAAGMAKQPGDRPADAATFVAALNQVAAGAYGPRWHERGRSHLGEAALLLAALWPSASLPAVQGTTVEKIVLHQRHLRSRVRHASAAKKTIAAAIAVVIAVAGTVVAIGLTRSASHTVTLPVVTGVSPASGSTAGGTTVTITGTGLADATVVRFGRAAGTITADSSTQITVTSPPSNGVVTTAAITADSGTKMTAAGAGTVDITVTTRVGTSHVTAADHYAYTAPRPAVTGVSPGVGSTAGGTTVTITGTGLAGATGVRFGGAAASLTADSSTQVTVTSPPGTGTVTITVTTPAGTSKTTEGHYTYTTRPEPAQSISFTAPASGTAGGSAGLSATGGGSGNPVVFTADPASGPGVCTRVRDHGDLHRGGHLRHRRQPSRERTLRGRTPGPAHDHGQRDTPVDLLHRPGLGDGGRLGGLVGHRRRLGQPGRVLLKQLEGVHRVRGRSGLHRGGQLRHRRQPGRQRTLHGRTPGPTHDHGQEDSPVDLLHRPIVGGGVVLGAPVGHRRRLGQPGRVLR